MQLRKFKYYMGCFYSLLFTAGKTEREIDKCIYYLREKFGNSST